MHAKTKKTSKGAQTPAVVDKTARRKEPPSRLVLVVALVLAAATLAVYWGTFHYEFTIWDDNTYVTGNPPVLAGLNAKSVAWAFSSGHAANWHPLTWLSLMLDAQIGGKNPAIYHIANVIIHVVNVLLLFLLLTSVTRLIWPSAFVAGLFALHPLQVESVAWVSERKDVLSALFCMLTSLAYVRYARKSNRANHALVLALFALGLMAKQMLVTLPVIFLLLDYWPLGRVGSKRLSALLIEKVPMIALSVLAGVLAIWTQAAGGSMRGVEKYPLGVRAAYAPVSYVAHLGKAVLPVDLAVFYPHPGTSLPDLFEHTLSVTRNNPVIENHLGAALCALNRVDEAVAHCREAVRLSARYPEAHYNLAHCLQPQGDVQAAIAEYQKAIQEKPDYSKALANLAIAYYYKADYQKAWEEAQLCQRYGGRLPPGLIQDIASRLRSAR